MANTPKKVTIRTYDVGFGDCFLLSFSYGTTKERHVLVDFGSTGFPAGVPKSRMMDIALDIKKRTGGQLTAVVATHRHKDHISGFETKKGGKGTGDIIRSLKPQLVVQPWTENPKLGTTATGPKDGGLGSGTGKHVAGLANMHQVAMQALAATRQTRYFAKPLKAQLSFLGETNLSNASAVKNLMTMATNDYIYCGKTTKLTSLLPGVRIHVLGPPTVKQTNTIKKQRSRDPSEFWQFQADIMRFATSNGGQHVPLFPRFVRSRGPNFPIDARWLIFHARSTRGEQLLEIVRMLDKAMNNTSVILVFEVGKKRLLFPGDAQIENWQYALSQMKYRELLSTANLYKVGHHGSRNATPKSLWALFRNKTTDARAARRLMSLMSTMEDKHGSDATQTEVPRKTLVSELKRLSNLFSTQELIDHEFFHDTELNV